MSAAPSRRDAAVRLLSLLLPALVVVAGCGSLADRKGPAPAATAAAPTPSPTTGPDAFERSGRGLDLRLTLPDATADKPYPLIVALHSLHYDGTQPQSTWGLDELARTAGFAVVYPDGLGRSWNAGTCCGTALATGSDDVGWLRALIGHLVTNYPIDPQRVSIIGLSNGGMLAYRYACEHGDELAGIAVVAGSLQVPECSPPAPVTVVAIHGGADGHVPLAGAWWSEVLQTGITPLGLSLAPFRAKAGCPDPTRPTDTVLTGADGRPLGTSALPAAQPGAVITGASHRTAAALAPAIPADPQAPASDIAPQQVPQQPALPQPDPQQAVPPQAPAAEAAVAFRTETVCGTSARVVQYLLPALGHGWPPLAGDGAFATAEVIWELLEPARSAVATPRL